MPDPPSSDAHDHVEQQLFRLSPERESVILSALGDPVSRTVLLQLNDQPRTVQELVRLTSVPQSSLYRKLSELHEQGLLDVQRSVVTREGRRTDLFRSLLVESTVHLLGGEVRVRARFRSLASERLADLWDDLRRRNNE